ncbi:MAG: hypothetical protein Q7U34_03160, partial [Anaerolineales bacterium]|nr:hypothetical protein [Anaerolineales bacterium]
TGMHLGLKFIPSGKKTFRVCEQLQRINQWQDINGLTEWLSGSGGTGETPSQLCTISGKPRSAKKRHSRCPLQPVLGRPKAQALAFFSNHSIVEINLPGSCGAKTELK